MDVGPIVSVFNALLTAGAAVSLAATAFFVMLAGFQYMSAGGGVRSVESSPVLSAARSAHRERTRRHRRRPRCGC